MLTQEQTSKLLGRTLTTTEISNFDLYMDLAAKNLARLVCFNPCGKEAATRQFRTVYGYSELLTDPFTKVNEITKDGEVITDYVVSQNGNLNGDWFNIIEFPRKQRDATYVIDADWGFDGCMPSDLQLLMANIFDLESKNQKSSNIKSKKIEDFTVTFSESTPSDEFMQNNLATIQKYSQCNRNLVYNDHIRPLCDY